MFGKKSPKPESKKVNAKDNQENEAAKSSESGEAKSVSLNGFRETIKSVLEDITSLEINTIIVSCWLPLQRWQTLAKNQI